MASVTRSKDRSHVKAYLVGGGIASLASAAYLIRDGGLLGENICVFEETPILGGSLDGAGSPETGYSLRGGRMFTYEAYTCTFDLLSFIPSLTAGYATVKEEIYAFNEQHVSNSHARLVRAGAIIEATTMGFSNRDRLDLLEIMGASFIQEFPRINTLGGVRRTPYNQYDSIELPLTTWLTEKGVSFMLSAQVTDLDFTYGSAGKGVDRIHYRVDDTSRELAVRPDDLVFVTNGSMTAASSLGSMNAPANLLTDDRGGSWTLWETLASKHTDFGRPAAFNGNVAESKWLSFTVN